MSFLRGFFVFIGTIIGVGIFALPWSTKEIGLFLTLFYFAFLATIAILVHLFFAKVCLLTEEKHRFPGYVFIYLGKNWARIALFFNLFGLLGAQLAYLAVGGNFLYQLFSPFFGQNLIFYLVLFFIFGSFFIFKGIQKISIIEIFANTIFLALLLFLFFNLYGKINPLNFSFNRFSFYPYGVILFSLWGSAIIPEIVEMVEKNEQLTKKIVIFGIIFSALIYLLFISLIVGICGKETSKDAFSCLYFLEKRNFLFFGFIFGIITCFTSYITLGLTLKKIFWYDLKIPKNLAFLLAVGIPLLAYILGARNFILVINLVGSVAIGIEGLIHVFLYKKAIWKNLNKKTSPLLYFIPIFLAMGAIAEILFILKK